MESNFDIKVKSPSPLVYITKAGEVKISSELELANRENLWGVQCGNIFVALKNSGFSDWQHAIHQEKVISPQWKISLPLEDDLGDCCVVRAQFKEVVEFLRNHGVAADDWLDGWYWSCEEQGRDNVHTFDMLKGCYATHDRFDSNGFVRFALVKLPE